MNLITFLTAPFILTYILASIVMAWPVHPAFENMAHSAVPMALAIYVEKIWLIASGLCLAGYGVIGEVRDA